MKDFRWLQFQREEPMQMAAKTFDENVVTNALAHAAANEAKALRKLKDIADATRRWHLVQINQNQFTLARIQLNWAGYELYAPLQREMIKPKSSELPVAHRKNRHLFAREKLTAYFGSYRFVRFDATLDPWHDLFKLVGVHGIGVANNVPVPMPDLFIHRLKSKEQNGAIPADTPVKALFYKLGDTAKVNEGPFIGFEGRVERVDESGRIRLLLEMFSSLVPVDLTADQVDKVTK